MPDHLTSLNQISRGRSSGAAVGTFGFAEIYEVPVRITSAPIKAAQEITTPDPVSNVPEQPMWHVGPVRVEGTISLPLVSDLGMRTLLESAIVKRNKRLVPGEIRLVFPATSLSRGEVRRFQNCVTNRLTMSSSAGDRVDLELSVLGENLLDAAGMPLLTPPDEALLLPFGMSRVITWEAVQISAPGDACLIRDFSIELDNNCSHNFTFQVPEEDARYVGARSITTGRRAVSGSLTYLGSSPAQQRALSNLVREGAAAIGEEGGSDLGIAIAPSYTDADESELFRVNITAHNVIYEWQDIDLTPDVVVSTTPWRAHGGGPGSPAATVSFLD
jgi:hypothetical protein